MKEKEEWRKSDICTGVLTMHTRGSGGDTYKGDAEELCFMESMAFLSSPFILLFFFFCTFSSFCFVFAYFLYFVFLSC